jgi:hypothetical protein
MAGQKRTPLLGGVSLCYFSEKLCSKRPAVKRGKPENVLLASCHDFLSIYL